MPSKTAVIIGGSGYIGRNLLTRLISDDIFDDYVVMDIRPLEGFESEIKSKRVVFCNADVREELPIITRRINREESWIFNFAAIHREPGHDFREYFDTNVPGANNVNEFAEKMNISNIFFTSSIAPYGKSSNQSTETSNLYPETGYGISKAFAEQIHQKWLAKKPDSRRLIIVRPSVIYGPHDPGNVYRMIKALKRGTFILPNGGNVIKAYGYIYGLIESILFTMYKKDESLIVYNYAEHPLAPLKEMTHIAKQKLGYSKQTFSVPTSLLVFIARFIQVSSIILGKKSEIHPVRVKKAAFPTNIRPKYLIDNGFEFKYGFEKSLEHWKETAPEDFKKK